MAEYLAPEGLEEAGMRLWRAIVDDVATDWELDARDLALLEAACRAEDRAAALDATVDSDGLMARGSTGQLVVHPAVVEARQQRALSARLLEKVEIAPPASGRRLPSDAQRDQLARARMARWPQAGGGHG